MEKNVNEGYYSPIDKTASTTAVKQIIERIKNAIINNKLKPGDRLPARREMMKIFGVGENVIKEAVHILVAMGVLEVKGNKGVYVQKGFSKEMLNPILYGIILNQSDSFSTVNEAAQWINFAVINLSVLKATSDDLTMLSKQLSILNEEIESGNVERIMAADDKFFILLFEASHNFLLIEIAKMSKMFTVENRRKMLKKVRSKGKLEDFFKNRSSILNSIQEKNVEHLHILLSEYDI